MTASCKWCPLEKEEHRRGLVTHEYEASDSPRRAEPALRVSTLAGDPVLRQALLDKGIISTSDLQKAERKLKSTQDIE